MNSQIDISEFGKTVPFIERIGIEALKMDADGIRIKVPLEPNINHIGSMYAGALWTLAEVMGGAVYHVYLAVEGTFPIVKELNIKFVRPAATDITCEYQMDTAEADRLKDECIEKGKANYDISLELKDAGGNVVAASQGYYQFRKGMGL
ncbi:MAG: YiiD C-terminal domain-containing protein [Desulfobacterales bacterium]